MAKGPRAYRDISEAAAEVGVEAHVLRYWEKELGFIRPLKRAGGRRFYRPRDIELLADVRRQRLAGCSLADIRHMARERPSTARPSTQSAASGASDPCGTRAWAAALARLEAAKRRLDGLLAADRAL